MRELTGSMHSNWLFYTGTYAVSAPLMSEIFVELNDTISSFDIPGGITWSIAFEPLPTVITKYGKLDGGNSLGTQPEDGNSFGRLPIGHFVGGSALSGSFSVPVSASRPFPCVSTKTKEEKSI